MRTCQTISLYTNKLIEIMPIWKRFSITLNFCTFRIIFVHTATIGFIPQAHCAIITPHSPVNNVKSVRITNGSINLRGGI